MEIVIDSHALFWFLSDNLKLPHKTKHLIKESDKVIIPSIALMEILYLLEKNNLAFRFVEFLSELKIRKYLVYPLDLNIIAQVISVSPELEMHDRIIIATAKIFNANLVSKDSQIKEHYLKTIW